MSPLRAYRAPLLWAALVLALGSVPDVTAPVTPLPLDKVAHLLLYGILGVLTGRGWQRAGRRPGRVLLIGLGLALGALDELHQARVPGRFPDPVDWAMDAAGFGAGFAGAGAVRRRLRSSN